MKHFRNALWLLVSAAISPLCATAQLGSQEVVAAAGEEYSNGEVRLGWTIGESVIATFEQENAALTQGFHQPIVLVTAIEHPLEAVSLRVYPNPAVDQLWMSVDERACSLRTYSVRNTRAQLLHSGLVHGMGQAPMRVDLQGIAPGLYLLVVEGECGRVARSFTVLAQ